MPSLNERLQVLSSAEDFFEFFGLPFDERVMRVSRLHILKRFYQYLHQSSQPCPQEEVAQYKRLRKLLSQAYGDFVSSTPAAEKVFKVFQDTPGIQHVNLSRLRDSLPKRDGRA